MIRFLRAIFGHDCPTRREMIATRDACDGLEARVERVYAELKQLRGKVNAMKRWEVSQDDEKAAQDAPGATISPPARLRAVAGGPKPQRGNY